MERQYNLKSPAVKRLMREAQELREPTEQYYAQPLEDNLFEWHFTIRGPADSDFEGGIYHGRIVLPPDYPMKPPSIILLTPNGRFEVYKKICLSISGHHPESWQPSWSIRTALLAIIGFMPTHGNGAIGSLDYLPEERKRLAKKTQEFKCSDCGEIKHILKPVTEASQATTEEAKELASQINFQGEKEKSAANNGQTAGQGEASGQGAAAAGASTAAEHQPQAGPASAAAAWQSMMAMPPFMNLPGQHMFPMPPTTQGQGQDQGQPFPPGNWMGWPMMPWMVPPGGAGNAGVMPPPPWGQYSTTASSSVYSYSYTSSAGGSNTATTSSAVAGNANTATTSPVVAGNANTVTTSATTTSTATRQHIPAPVASDVQSPSVRPATTDQPAAAPSPDGASSSSAAPASTPASPAVSSTQPPSPQPNTNEPAELRRRTVEARRPAPPSQPLQQRNTGVANVDGHRRRLGQPRQRNSDWVVVAMGFVAFFLVVLVFRRLWLWDFFSFSR